ncbi:hypothetical protein [Agromyces humi]|uniref:hypothetical protein n=1 Tax=Agromyces humi TaxID=1766800 RepID=UPI00193942DC|nr:hypothetical protein [Agromyces humi]
MYAALFRTLPGPLWLRIVLVVILAAAIVLALFAWGYPWMDTIIDPQDVTVADPAAHE